MASVGSTGQTDGIDILLPKLLILASAGSGKTYQLAQRIIGLVAHGQAPERIVALTFTRKAAAEFADTVLNGLAQAATEPDRAAALRGLFNLPSADFGQALDRVVRALPQFTLGTMDSFFSRVVRGFQYELGLTGARFELIQGPRAAALTDELLGRILGHTLPRPEAGEFFHAFRRATIGRADTKVLEALRNFIRTWHNRYRETDHVTWGPEAMETGGPEEWEQHKASLAGAVRNALDEAGDLGKAQRVAMDEAIDLLEAHTIGSGSLGSDISALPKNILAAVAVQTSGPLQLKYRKEFVLNGAAATALRRLVNFAAACELTAALRRTRAVREVVALYERQCAQRLRQQGLLGFDDVKFLMGGWASDETARLSREAVDFRLDARTDHWLLDEFQDTSRADWQGLLPLVGEAATSDEHTLFIVGDRKQAIYGWRGGDVRLFDEVRRHYRIATMPMVESWRSCPQVLDLVNRVCGDQTTMRRLFGGAVDRWEWQDHLSAEPLRKPERAGESRVEVVGDWTARMARCAGMLAELGAGRRKLSIGILLRANDKVGELTDFLRGEDIDVIEEGTRKPAEDNPIGIFIRYLLAWLADRSNSFAWEVVAMSPLAADLQHRHGPEPGRIWNQLTQLAAGNGFAAMVEHVIEAHWDGWSEFGQRRAGDLLETLAEFDAQGRYSPREAAEWLERLEVSQAPGEAAVQVMTIHKSKGLGFDVVILPDVPDQLVPMPQRFDVAEGPQWLTQPPPKWARELLPDIREAEAIWAENQRYEAFCTLYVALTRAKRGLYVMLDPPAASADPDKPSLANWLASAISSAGGPGVVYQRGDPGWLATVPMLDSEKPFPALPALGRAVPRRTRITPSGLKSSAAKSHAHSSGGMAFGTAVHALLERVTWVDDCDPILPDTPAGQAVAGLIHHPALDNLFHRRGRQITLHREQATDAIVDHAHLTGVIDRLHLHHGPDGNITAIEIIDFKTDAVDDPAHLATRYAGQMNAYRDVLARIHPAASIRCTLLSVRHACRVDV